MKKQISLFILVVMISDCYIPYSANSIKSRYARIDYSDGISKKEAVIIAQNICLEDEGCRKNYCVSCPRVYGDCREWIVIFYPKRITLPWITCAAYIDKKTGKFLRWHCSE